LVDYDFEMMEEFKNEILDSRDKITDMNFWREIL
jgi:hypothetical protein